MTQNNPLGEDPSGGDSTKLRQVGGGLSFKNLEVPKKLLASKAAMAMAPTALSERVGGLPLASGAVQVRLRFSALLRLLPGAEGSWRSPRPRDRKRGHCNCPVT